MSTSAISSRWGSLKGESRLKGNVQTASFGIARSSSADSGKALLDLYRCPQALLDLSPEGNLSNDNGYFHFGPEVICYGQSSAGTRQPQANSVLDDLLQYARCDNGALRLPFDPNRVIENLRLERYDAVPNGFEGLLRRMYYSVRPLTTAAIRRRVQQLHARNWKQRRFPHWPLDTTVEDLSQRLMLMSMQAKGIDRVPFVWFWPEGARGCLMMTHDVENVSGRDACNNLMDLDDAFGVKASFQIVPESRYEVPAGFLESIRRRGFEIGVQDLNHDGRLYDSREEFKRRAEIINGYGREYGARGFRAGVLYRKPEWLDALDFSFDMSFPNVAHLDPQRGGCCTVMPYFIGDILELPVTTTQDYTLFHVLREDSIDLWKTQTELILAKNGLVSFIVHPDYVIEDKYRRRYAELLEYLQRFRERENLWHALPSAVDQWWRMRSRLSVVENGSSYQIVGEGAEQAVLAFARREGDRLVYELSKS